MSLGGIAIAIGAMVDAAIVMIENAHKKLEAWKHAHASEVHAGVDPSPRRERWRLITEAAVRSGRAVLQPARHHAVVRAHVHAGGAGRTAVRTARVHQDAMRWRRRGKLAVTLVPVLMGYFIRGRIPARTPIR